MIIVLWFTVISNKNTVGVHLVYKERSYTNKELIELASNIG